MTNTTTMTFDKSFLDTLTEQAKVNSRLRQNYDLRNSETDNSQRMLNAMEPGTELPIHRHPKSSETVVIVRGAIKEWFYDAEGHMTDEIILDADGELRMLNVPKGVWHNSTSLKTGTIIFEAKDGVYQPLTAKDIIQ